MFGEQTIERHLTAREEVSWGAPPIRLLLNVSPPNICERESGLCSIEVKSLEQQIATLEQFTALCTASLEITEKISTNLLPILQRVVSEYTLVVCDTCIQALRTAIAAVEDAHRARSWRVTLSTRVEALADAHRRMLDDISVRNPGLTKVYHTGWVAMTVSDIVYYALAELATRHGVDFGRNFAVDLKRICPQFEQWAWTAAPLTPSTVCFDNNFCVLGTTFAHWNGWKQLEEWEKCIRQSRIRSSVRVECEKAHQAIVGTIECHPALNKSALIERAIRTLRASSTYAVCNDLGPWWAADGKLLFHKDQCPTCQVWFSSVELLVQNEREHRDRLGYKRDSATPWQCAEVDLHSQLIDFGYTHDIGRCAEIDGWCECAVGRSAATSALATAA